MQSHWTWHREKRTDLLLPTLRPGGGPHGGGRRYPHRTARRPVGQVIAKQPIVVVRFPRSARHRLDVSSVPLKRTGTASPQGETLEHWIETSALDQHSAGSGAAISVA